MLRSDSTIAAISTAPGASGIGIVRISGPDAFFIAEKVFHPKNKEKRIKEQKSHTIHYGWIFDQEQPVDEVLLMLMKAPHTYTGEDTIEIDCHGGIYSTRRVLETVVKAGARISEPGEFTKRAFLNGRMDLSQAESVMDVIEAKNENALKSSLKHLRGMVYSKIENIRERLLYEIAYIESALDDPEHYSLDNYQESLKHTIDDIINEIVKLLSRSQNGKLIREGIRTVIVGKPNAGKSSLMNLLTGEEKAIVTDIAGTTRDILDEYINLNGISLHLIDTAGIRKTDDYVEKIGVEKAIQAADDADLTLFVMDSSTEPDDNDRYILKLLNDKNVIILYNKTDLAPKVTIEEIQMDSSHKVIPVSMKEETGIEELEREITEMFFKGNIAVNDELYITNERQMNALKDCVECLRLVQNGIQDQLPEDFLSIDLRDACDCLGYITGETVGEDLVEEIFSRFCMGK